MPWDIPSPTTVGNGLLQGLETGSTLMQRLLQSRIAQQQEQRMQAELPSQIAYREAQTGAIPSEVSLRNSETNFNNNPLRLDKLRAEIESEKELANQRKFGLGDGAGAGLHEIGGIIRQVVMDNPGIDINKANQITSAYLSGSDTLPNGEKVPAASGITQSLLDQNFKRGTTGPLVTKGVQANQAHTEIKVLSDYAQKGLAPYGDTVLNMSPKQIVDSFKSDTKSQTQLGRLIAAKQLQYEIAQNEIKLANGEPGINATNELMALGSNNIKTMYPKLSYQARKEANRYFIEALDAGLLARNKLGIRATSAVGKQTPSGSSEQTANSSQPITFIRDKDGKIVRYTPHG
jgi:hypothetical protein